MSPEFRKSQDKSSQVKSSGQVRSSTPRGYALQFSGTRVVWMILLISQQVKYCSQVQYIVRYIVGLRDRHGRSSRALTAGTHVLVGFFLLAYSYSYGLVGLSKSICQLPLLVHGRSSRALTAGTVPMYW